MLRFRNITISLDEIFFFLFMMQDKALAAKYNIDEFPSLVFFENQIPSVYDEDIENPDQVMSWIVDLVTGADIEQVECFLV